MELTWTDEAGMLEKAQGYLKGMSVHPEGRLGEILCTMKCDAQPAYSWDEKSALRTNYPIVYSLANPILNTQGKWRCPRVLARARTAASPSCFIVTVLGRATCNR
jgi:hypothetical protein